MGAMKAAIGDALITFAWMFCVSTLGAFTSIISSALQLHGVASMLGITIAFIGVLVFVFNIIADALGGASFNPTGNAAFYAAGLGGDSLFSMALRFPAQAAGAVGGVLAIMEFMPSQYKHTLGGPALKVDLHTGAVAEGVLTFLITFAVLWIMIKGPGSSIVKTWMLAVATVAMIIAGSGYTGPSMNPANAFDNDAELGWQFVKEDGYKLVTTMLKYRRMKEKEKEEDNSEEKKVEVPPVEEAINNNASTSSKPTKCYGWSSDEEED